MVEACPVCDTLWRLYAQGIGNLHDLAAKHGEAREKGDPNATEVLSHEITISEWSLRAVRRELRRHEVLRHRDPKPQPQETGQTQPK